MNLVIPESEQKIKELFDNHFHSLVLHAFRYIGDYCQSEEIVQDVFVKVWQNFEKVQDIKNLKAYLYKAVHNSSLNYLRHLKIQQKYLAEAAFINDTIENSVEDSITEAETSNRVHNVVNKLPSNWKEALILSKYDKLKYHEIAEKMNISQKTVEKYISKALQLLRIELKDMLMAIILFFKLQ
jgi:RNA polymerase sigma-70 factor (ECF subfamily)